MTDKGTVVQGVDGAEPLKADLYETGPGHGAAVSAVLYDSAISSATILAEEVATSPPPPPPPEPPGGHDADAAAGLPPVVVRKRERWGMSRIMRGQSLPTRRCTCAFGSRRKHAW